MTADNLMFKCPGCDTFYSPDPAVVEVNVSLKGELGGERTRRNYCPPCGKLIEGKGVDHWDGILEEAIRNGINPQSPIVLKEIMVREVLVNLGASPKYVEAMVDHIFNKGGALGRYPYEFDNRDRVVAFVIAKSKDILTA